MNLIDIISTIFGIAGIVSGMLVFQQKSRKKIIGFKLITDLLWAVHFILMCGYTAAAIAMLGVVRELIFMNLDITNKKSRIWLIVFLSAAIACGIFTWQSIFSVFPIIASMISVVAFFIGNPRLTRILAYPISISMAINGIAIDSFSNVLNEILIMSSTTLALLKDNINKSHSA